jgi:hypothetical protein
MPAIPTKLFDVRQGNNSVDSDATVYPRATLIVFRDNAAKDAVIDAFADVHGWEAMDAGTRPNKQAFFNQELQYLIRETVRQSRERTEQKKIVAPVLTDLP